MDLSNLENISDAEVQSFFFRACGEFNTGVETLRKGIHMFPQDVVAGNYEYLQDTTEALRLVQVELVRRMIIEQRKERRRMLGTDPEGGDGFDGL